MNIKNGLRFAVLFNLFAAYINFRLENTFSNYIGMINLILALIVLGFIIGYDFRK
jgi:hypothetical protein